MFPSRSVTSLQVVISLLFGADGCGKRGSAHTSGFAFISSGLREAQAPPQAPEGSDIITGLVAKRSLRRLSGNMQRVSPFPNFEPSRANPGWGYALRWSGPPILPQSDESGSDKTALLRGCRCHSGLCPQPSLRCGLFVILALFGSRRIAALVNSNKL